VRKETAIIGSLAEDHRKVKSSSSIHSDQVSRGLERERRKITFPAIKTLAEKTVVTLYILGKEGSIVGV
jgi:hypothetical protein